MPQIILKERTADVVRYTSFTRDVVKINTRHFHSSINCREQLFQRSLNTGYFRPVEYCKVFKHGLFYRTPPEAVVCKYSSQ